MVVVMHPEPHDVLLLEDQMIRVDFANVLSRGATVVYKQAALREQVENIAC